MQPRSGSGLSFLLTSVCLQAIQERIKNLEFQDCKVRVTNVDSQGSGEHIVIQVIGEISNKSQEPKKFVQTFVLAQQPSGYFVLNDIMRYIDEEDEQEPATETEQAPASTEPQAAAAVEGHVEPEHSPVKEEEPTKGAEAAPLDTAVVDEKLEEAKADEASAPTEKAAEPAVEAEPAVVETKEDAQPEPVSAEEAIKEVEKEEAQVEERKEPSPTPAAPKSAPVEKPAPAEPEKPKEPPKPMTWASRIAAAAGPAVKAVIPSLPKIVATPAQPKPAPASAQKAPAAAAQPTESSAPAASAPKETDEWQSVDKRQNRPASISGPGQETGREGAMAYIKYVTEKVDMEDLRAELVQYGELVYFDVNRTKVSYISDCTSY